ncbi:MAG TPA: VOC family protein [Candidatus Dormibacteraeota bacterium]|nr:VOC family protein [Candidatus Dormibacteraeota bacterium]
MSNSVRTCLTFKDRAEEAVNLYVSIFPNSKITHITRVEDDGGPIPKGKLLVAIFELDGQEFRAFDGGETFTFNEGISLDVTCKSQAEVDKYWTALIANGGEESQCGWLKDRFGVSWQIIPEQLGQMLSDLEHGNSEAAMQAMLKMKKIDIAELEKAYHGARVA